MLLDPFWNTYILHPLKGNGYQFWSGIGSDIGQVVLIGGAATFVKHHNCHEKGCWRLGHAHPGHGQPVCRKHYHRPVAGIQGVRDGGDVIGETTEGGDW